MSGGYFDYNQDYINNIADAVGELIRTNGNMTDEHYERYAEEIKV